MSCGLLYRRSPSSVSVLFSFRFRSFFVFIFIFCMVQASSTVRILALCKSFALPRPAQSPSLRSPYSCPAKRINGADNGRGTWRLWEMSTGRGGEHARGREGRGRERGSASSTVVKFHLSTNQLPNSCRRVLPLTMLRSLSYSRFPPLLPSFPFPASRFCGVFPIPAGYAISSRCFC